MSRRDFGFLIAALAVLLMMVPTTALAEDWPQWRGIDRSGRSPETGLFETWGEDGPELAWIAEGMGSGYASVSVADGMIYTSGNGPESQFAVAVNADDGSVAWKQPVTEGPPKHGYDGSRTTPTVDGENLYLVSSDGKIVCLRRSDGSLVWSRNFSQWNGKMMSGWGFSESPLVDGDRVICTPGGDQGLVVALDKTTGQEVWTCTLPSGEQASSEEKSLKDGAAYSSAVISHGGGVKQYVQLVGRGLIGVRASDGQLLWHYDRVGNRTANIPTPIVKDDDVFTSTAYGTGSALLRLTGDGQRGVDAKEVYWLEGRELQNKHGGMVLVDGYIYCGHGNGSGFPICVEMMTGKIAWGPERAEGSGETSLVYADGRILYRRADGTLLLTEATPEEFRVIDTFMPAYQEGKSWAHPVIANGMLYLREQNKLMCYRLKASESSR